MTVSETPFLLFPLSHFETSKCEPFRVCKNVPLQRRSYKIEDGPSQCQKEHDNRSFQ